jgi:hypothetical protein
MYRYDTNLVSFEHVPVVVNALISARKKMNRGKHLYTIPNYVIKTCAHYLMTSHLGSICCFWLEQVNVFAKGKTTISHIFRAVLKALNPTVYCPILT